MRRVKKLCMYTFVKSKNDKMRFNLLLLFTLTFQFVFSQTAENTVTLTTSGTGKTLEEAKNNALRSAIEQAFGAFISSKTEILNDDLVKDEIVSISSGNIVKYDVISDAKINENLFTTTVTSVVSISRLTSYSESKGVQVEFKGSLFSANLKLQKLNEEAEYKAVVNLCETSMELLNSSLEFTVETTEPVLTKDKKDVYQVDYKVTCATNENYNQFKDHFFKTALSISMEKTEVEEYNKLKKPVFSFVIVKVIGKKRSTSGCPECKKEDVYQLDTIKLRNLSSAIAFQNLFIRSNVLLMNFVIHNDIENLVFISNNRFVTTDGWVLNVKGSQFSYPDFYFGAMTEPKYNDKFDYRIFKPHQGLKPSIEIFQCFVQDKRLSASYFFIPKNMFWSRDLSNLDYDPHGYRCGYFPTPNNPDNLRSGEIFGTLNISSKPVIEHRITKFYTLEQLSKMSFVKIEPLK